MKSLSKHIKANKLSLIPLKEKLIVNKEYKSNDSIALKEFIADNIDLNYAYIMRSQESILLGERIFNMFRRVWEQCLKRPNEWDMIKEKHIDTEVRELVKTFNKYYEVCKFTTTASEADKKAGLYYLFDNLKEEGFEIVDLAEKLNNYICIRYILFDDIIIFQYGKHKDIITNPKFEVYTTFITWKGKLKNNI